MTSDYKLFNCYDPAKFDRMNSLYTLYIGLGYWI